MELHPQNLTTFVVDRNINYTNVCWVDCKFCAFYRHHKEEVAYVLSFEEIGKKIEELIEIGGTQILFQGGVHPKLKIEWYEELVEWISTHYPKITIHGFSAIEIDYIAKISNNKHMLRNQTPFVFKDQQEVSYVKSVSGGTVASAGTTTGVSGFCRLLP